MMPNVTRGGRMAGLTSYLAGPGRANEHTRPHLVAGDDRVEFAVAPGQQLDTDDALDIANVLDQPRKFHDTEVNVPVREFDEQQDRYVTTGTKPGHVWHCSLSLRPEEGQLTSEQWGTIAEDFVDRMGFIDEDGAKSSRWAAFHHGQTKNGGDHIHIAVQMVREDGTKANVHNDFARAQKVCSELEQDHNLEILEARGQGRSISADKPAERARAEREGRGQNHRDELRRRMRSALAGAEDQGQYVKNLVDLGVQVAPRFAEGSSSHVVGYKVALPPTKYQDGSAEDKVWYAPSKLDSNLSWPRLQDRFGARGEAEAHRLLGGLKSGEHKQPQKASAMPQWSPAMLDRLQSGKTEPDTLANIYARVSMSVEQNRPGALNALSGNYARLSQGVGNNFYAVRTMNRAASKNRLTSWKAVLQQANRMSRAMMTSQAMQRRPMWAAQNTARLSSAEALVGAGSAPTKMPQSAGGSDRGLSYQERTRQARTQEIGRTGRDHDLGR